MNKTETEIRITLNVQCAFRPWRVAYFTGAQLFVIGLGIWAESTAMQWIGFAALVVMFFALALQAANPNKMLTFQEARDRIDEIERENAK